MRRGWFRALAAAVALAASAVAVADRETAKFAAGRGDKALAAKKWDEAETHYRKALEEDETFLPARYGLAQALVGGGRSAAAVEELRAVVEKGKADAALPPEWKPLLAKAQKQLADLDASGNALQKIQDGYVDALTEFGQRWATKDPTTAERALRRALDLRPGHARAAQLLSKMGKSTAEVVVLYDGGEEAKGWVGFDLPTWEVSDGAMLAQGRDGAYFVRSDRRFDGDFTVRAEARLVEEYVQPTYFCLMACWNAVEDYYAIGILRGKVSVMDKTDVGKSREPFSVAPPALKKPFDATQWNTYEMRFRGGEIVSLVNGEEIGREERPEWRTGGFIGIVAQNVKVAFRRIEVEAE